MARTKLPGKKTILVRKDVAKSPLEIRRKSNPKLIRVRINDEPYPDDVRASHAIGGCLFHMLPDLHLRSVHSMLYNIETAKELVSVLLDKPSKQLAAIQKMVDNAREKLKERGDMEYPETRSHLISYITEHVMRYEGLGELHGFMEVVPKRR